MRFKEFITEGTSELNVSKLTKRPKRLEKFIDLISQKHSFKSKSGPVQIDPESASVLSGLTKASKTPMLTTVDGRNIRMSDIYYDQQAWGEKGRSGDTSVQIKPANVLKQGNPEKDQPVTPDIALELGGFTAGQLGDRIINNEYLKSHGETGLAVIEIAKQLVAKQVPAVPKVDASTLTVIQNDAFEYLGVLSLVSGVANFPASKEFYDHLGSDLSNLVLLFPKDTNNPLADSYALVNENSEHTIFISSKAGKKGKGAPSSINKLKIPEHMIYKKSEAIEFITTIQETKGAMYQPFVAANFLMERYGSFQQIEDILPEGYFDDDFFKYITNVWKNQRTTPVPSKIEEIPEMYQGIFDLADRSYSGNASLFYKIRNFVKDVLVNEEINNGTIPGFSETMLELLGQNFIVISTKAQGGRFITDVKWPNKMGGKIILAPKDGADKWGSSMTWILS
jgi:hypothetical protein